MSCPPHSASSAGRLTVLIVDDHFVVRSGLRASLELDDQIEVVGEVDRGEEALTAYREHRPAVVMLDLQLPDVPGVQVAAALREADPAARILIYSSYARDDEIHAAFEAGALGFLQKSAPRDELITALRTVARGGRHLAPDLARRLTALRIGPVITPREREILGLIAAGRANKEIGDLLSISEDTVKRHVSHILQKLEVHDRAQATAEAIRRGIVKVPE
jgi:DNA-binding NarL/FixJ family response regulator